MTTYIGLAVSGTMFPIEGNIKMTEATPEEVQHLVVSQNITSALNPSHTSTIDAIRRKFDLALPVPETAPKVSLAPGDSLIIIQAHLPRLAEGEVHSAETIERADITFRRWTLLRQE